MAARRTRVTLSIPWDDETHEHPANWGYDVLLGLETIEGQEVILVDFEEVTDQGTIEPL